MSSYKEYLIVLLTLFLFYNEMMGQTVVSERDSLKLLSYNDLILKMSESNDSLSKIYCAAFLTKAKKENDADNIILGYDLFALFNEKEKPNLSLTYLDSMVQISQRVKDTFNITTAFLQKATIRYAQRNFEKALDNYLMSYKYSKAFSNQKLLYSSQHGIGTLKLRVGDYQEALNMHINNLDYFKISRKEFSQDDHLNTIFSLAVSYKKLGDLKLATEYNKKGVLLSSRYDNSEMYNLFTLNEGTIAFIEGDLNRSFDSIQKSMPYFERYNLKADLAFAYYYLGKIYLKKNEDSLAINYLKKVDTIFQITNDLNPELEPTYKLLSDYYKRNGDTEKQLDYLSKLITFDSLMNTYITYVHDGINKQYDIPLLMSERDHLITSLESTTSRLSYGIGLAVFTIICVYFTSLFHQRTLKSRFEQLLKTSNEKSDLEYHKINTAEELGLQLPIHTVNEILTGLKEFEKNHGFKDYKLTQLKLAKTLNTNSNYLSKVINYKKGKNFTSYINDLRLAFAFEELRDSLLFRNYKISAIAKESGFNNAETFSRLFKKKNGIYPSYFIKHLNKSSLNINSK